MSVSSNVAEEEDPMLRRFLREWEFSSERIDRWESAQPKGKIPVHQEPEIYPDEGPGALELALIGRQMERVFG